jgi:type VI secretion system protein ImpH
VIARLQQAPHRFEFAQAVRLLLIWLRHHGIPHDRAIRELLRFQNSLSLGFPASEIQSLTLQSATALPQDRALHPKDLEWIHLTPAFIGLLGANGTLPLHYTEHIAAYEHEAQDQAARAYFDIFSHRIVAQFAQAWGKYRIEHSLDVHGNDKFRPMLLSLGGGHAGVCRGKHESGTGLSEDIAAFYIGLLRQRPVSVAALRCILPDYFGVPIVIEQFIGRWNDIADNRQCKMGGPNAALGYSGALGVRVWRRDLHVRLRIGPLSREDFERFLPGAPGTLALERLLAMLGVASLQYLAHVVLKSEEIGPLVLTGGAAKGIRLGWDACLGAERGRGPADVSYLLCPS